MKKGSASGFQRLVDDVTIATMERAVRAYRQPYTLLERLMYDQVYHAGTHLPALEVMALAAIRQEQIDRDWRSTISANIQSNAACLAILKRRGY